MPPPMEKQLGKALSPGEHLQYHGQAGVARSDSAGSTAAPEHGNSPGTGFGGPTGKGLVPTVPWGSGREGLAGSAPHTSAPAPSGLLFKAHVG